MKELKISDELFSRFMEGTASEEENEQILQSLAEDSELLDEFTAIAEAAKLANQEPLRKPDLAEASRQIKTNMPVAHISTSEVSPKHRHRIQLYIAAAAMATILLASTFYLLLRPTPNEGFLARQDETTTDTLLTTPLQNEILVAENEVPQNTLSSIEQKNDNTESEPNVTTSTHSQTNEYRTSLPEEKHYGSKSEVSEMVILKPSKSKYAILCKNLDKSFTFEWTATNVQSLQLTIKNSEGKVIAETTAPDARRYELPYRSIYPEKQISWNLVVNYRDNTQEQHSGQIQIDYNLNN